MFPRKVCFTGINLFLDNNLNVTVLRFSSASAPKSFVCLTRTSTQQDIKSPPEETQTTIVLLLRIKPELLK